MKAEFLAPISQAVATFAGALFVLVGIWYRERLEGESRSKNARIQIVAEIRALLDLIELNSYLPHTRELIEALHSGKLAYLNFSSNRSFVSVYEANLLNLGHLNGSASEVVRFYMVLLSALEDKDMIVEMGRKLEAKRAAGAERPALRLNYTVNNDNLAQMTALLSVFGSYGPATIQIRPMADLGDTAYTDKDLRRSLDAYNAGIVRLRRDCETAGVRLLANTQDPLYRSENQRAVVYEHAVLRYIGPQRVWREGFDPMTESYGMLKRRTGFRRSLLRWAAFGSSDLERASTLSTSDVF